MEKIIHKEAERRFEMTVEGAVAFIEYEVRKTKVLAFMHTRVPDAHKGKGVASQLARGAFGWCKEHGFQIIPVCPYIVAFIKRHPEWSALKYDE